MLKINLSKEQDDNKQNSSEIIPESIDKNEDEELYPEVIEEQEAKRRIRSFPVLIFLIVLFILSLVYFQKNMILGLFAGRKEIPEPVILQPQPSQPPPEPEVISLEPDPTFVALNGISEVVPMRLWLSSAVVMYDGSYELKGIAFSHATVFSLIASLENLGAVTSKSIPQKLKSSEAVYTFSISGVLRNISVPEILDIIPTEKLIAITDAVKEQSKEYGISFTRFPQSGKTYTENDLPFGVEGSYEGLKNAIGALCPEGSDIKVYRLTISPASPGKAFDKINASFSLRMLSSI